jgi:Transcription factor WhiB
MREPREYEAPLCAEVGGEYWFPEDISGVGKYESINLAKSICGNCRHRIECAEWGIYKERYGMWGGLTSSQRRFIRRKRGIVLPPESREDKSA